MYRSAQFVRTALDLRFACCSFPLLPLLAAAFLLPAAPRAAAAFTAALGAALVHLHADSVPSLQPPRHLCLSRNSRVLAGARFRCLFFVTVAACRMLLLPLSSAFGPAAAVAAAMLLRVFCCCSRAGDASMARGALCAAAAAAAHAATSVALGHHSAYLA